MSAEQLGEAGAPTAAPVAPPAPTAPPPAPLMKPQEWEKPAVNPAAICSDGRTAADRFELLKESASDMFKAGRIPMAIHMYSEAIKLAPSHTLYSNRSACYCTGGKYVEAFEDACKCVDMMPTWAKGYARKGAALHGMDRWEEAIKAYEAGLKMEPGSRILEQGKRDAERRRKAAGGEWTLIANDKTVEDEWGRTVSFMKLPTLICQGPIGGMCVYDQDKEIVRVMNADASYVRCSLNADKETNRAGLYGQPHGLAFDGDFIFITDRMRCRVIKCDSTNGKLVAKIGRSGCDDGFFDEPNGLALINTSAQHGGEADTTLFVADGKNHRVVALNAADLSFRYKFGNWGWGDGELIEPMGIAAHGDLLAVTDKGNKRVCLFSLTGEYLRSIGAGGVDTKFDHAPVSIALTEAHLFVLEEPQGMEKDKPPTGQAGHIHCLDPHNGTVLRPPLMPPFAVNSKRKGCLNAVAVFNGNLYATSSYGVILALPR